MSSSGWEQFTCLVGKAEFHYNHYTDEIRYTDPNMEVIVDRINGIVSTLETLDRIHKNRGFTYKHPLMNACNKCCKMKVRCDCFGELEALLKASIVHTSCDDMKKRCGCVLCNKFIYNLINSTSYVTYIQLV